MPLELVPAIEIHNLPEQGHFAHAARDQVPHLGHDLADPPRPLPSPREGDDAVGAHHIAPLHDRDEGRGLPLRQHMLADGLLRAGLLLHIDDGKADIVHQLLAQPQLAAVERIDVLGHAMKLLRAHDEIDVPHIAGQLIAAALRHAAEKAEDHLGPVLAQPPEHAHFAERLLLRHIAHGARVQEHHVGLRLLGRLLITARHQIAQDLLGIPLVHLAAVGFQEDFGHKNRRL